MNRLILHLSFKENRQDCLPWCHASTDFRNYFLLYIIIKIIWLLLFIVILTYVPTKIIFYMQIYISIFSTLKICKSILFELIIYGKYKRFRALMSCFDRFQNYFPLQITTRINLYIQVYTVYQKDRDTWIFWKPLSLPKNDSNKTCRVLWEVCDGDLDYTITNLFGGNFFFKINGFQNIQVSRTIWYTL